MPDAATFGLFLTAAFVVGITPGPGILYVLTRSLKGGRSEGVASSFGNGVGGLVHVVAATFGLSAILMSSATAYNIVKFAGAAYLVYLGIRTLLDRDHADIPEAIETGGHRDAFYQGIVSEVLNPKSALFFLAFLPQFVSPDGPVIFQILVLGSISVSFNTIVDLIVACFAGPIGTRLRENIRFKRGQRLFTGCALIGLGSFVAVAGEKR